MVASNILEAQKQRAIDLDAKDPLKHLRDEFCFPQVESPDEVVYLVGNSLGLAPKTAKLRVNEALDDWARFGVEGHFRGSHPWYPYHEFVTEAMARVVGALPLEVVVMNSLTVNLHLMLVSFYRPSPTRFKVVMERGAFPSDQYAVASQVRAKGFDPDYAIVELSPRPGEFTLRSEDIINYLETEGHSVALILLGQVNYLTGQAFEIQQIGKVAREQGITFGLDLAHGAGNLNLKLHEWQVDFAVWCSYKYLNSGPGGIAGCFVHERHANHFELPRFAGWWGHNKERRFLMGKSFEAMSGAEGWQLSNPPILQLASLRASLEIFDRAGMEALSKKSQSIVAFLERMLEDFPAGMIEQLTPKDPHQRGTQLSLRVKGAGKELIERLTARAVFCDFREPDVIRVAPVPLYTSYMAVFRFVAALRTELGFNQH